MYCKKQKTNRDVFPNFPFSFLETFLQESSPFVRKIIFTHLEVELGEYSEDEGPCLISA